MVPGHAHADLHLLLARQGHEGDPGGMVDLHRFHMLGAVLGHDHVLGRDLVPCSINNNANT